MPALEASREPRQRLSSPTMSSTEESTCQSPVTKKAIRALSRLGKDIVVPPIKDSGSGLMVRHIATKAMKSDLMLKVRDRGTGEQHFYLVDASTLRDASPYFSTLLDPNKFAEGIRLDERTKELGKKHAGDNAVPLADLPVVALDDVGQVPPLASTEAVFTLFLCILHSLVVPLPQPDWSSLAMLAIIADRFDALEAVATFVARRGWTKRCFSWDERTPLGTKREKLLRQQILVALLFGIAPLLRKQTATLIVADSILWSEDEVAGKIDQEALWWDLPQGIEGTSARDLWNNTTVETDLSHRRRDVVSSWIPPRNDQFAATTLYKSIHLRAKSMQIRLRLVTGMQYLPAWANDTLLLPLQYFESAKCILAITKDSDHAGQHSRTSYHSASLPQLSDQLIPRSLRHPYEIPVLLGAHCTACAGWHLRPTLEKGCDSGELGRLPTWRHMAVCSSVVGAFRGRL